MTKVIDAAEFISMIKSNPEAFEVSGRIEVKGKVELPAGRFKTLNLDCLTFDEIDFRGSYVEELLLGSMRAMRLYCESAHIKHINLEDASICDLDFGDAIIGDLCCGDSKIQWVNFGETSFGAVHAVNNPALAWVIQQYIQSKVQYGIDDAPPWLLERSPKMPGINT